MKKKKDEIFSIRITDWGAISAILQTINTLTFIKALLINREITRVDELVTETKSQLKKYLSWLERIPDATLYENITKKEVELIKKDAHHMLEEEIVPTKEDYKKRKKIFDEFKGTQSDLLKKSFNNKVNLLLDSSFYLSYILKNEQFSSVNFIVQYLKTQKKQYLLHLPNFVSLELISQLVRNFSFKKAIKIFNDLIEELADGQLAIKKDDLQIHDIFDRYKDYCKKDISKKLRGNDFVIATEGIATNAIILTCDKSMHDQVKKFYKRIFIIDKTSISYRNFFNKFEQEKEVVSERGRNERTT